MVEDEILMAHEAQVKREGLPYLLPVRVAYDGPLPEPLDTALGRLQYVYWRGEEDDGMLVSTIQQSLEKPDHKLPLEAVGGAVPLDSNFYIVRPTDRECLSAIDRRDSIVLIKGARQMGKTSLLTRSLQKSREKGAICLRTDFQKLTSSSMKNEEIFFYSLAEMLSDQFPNVALPEDVWNQNRSAIFNFQRYIEREILGKADKHVVWALDEVDKLFACSYGGDVFALFRSWHNDRAFEPDGVWKNLTMAIAYATEPHLFITDINQSPFNVGTRLALSDFNLDQLTELNARYSKPLHNLEELTLFQRLTGGQPYLARRGFDYLVQQKATIEELERDADRDEGIFGDHLRRLLVALSNDPGTLEVVKAILRGAPVIDVNMFYRLRAGGLLAGSSERDFRIRCDTYTTYLTQHLF